MKQINEYAVHFFISGSRDQFAYRRLFGVPRKWDVCVFDEKRYVVNRTEWCLDEDATEHGTRINIELNKI